MRQLSMRHRLSMLPGFAKRFRVQVALRVGAILLAAMAAALGAARLGGYGPYALAAALLAMGYLAFDLGRYVERTMRDVVHFLQAVRYGDFSHKITTGGRGKLSDELEDAFQSVMEAFRKVRAEREEQVRYLQNVVQHVGVALIAYGQDGRVELINSAAKRLLGVSSLRHVETLRAVSEELVQKLLQMGAGEQVLLRVEREDRTLQLSIFATQYRMRGSLQTLVSLQDIRQVLDEKEMEAWQQLTSVLTHEIMNSVAPIASVANTAHKLLADAPVAAGAGVQEDVYEALEVIERRSKALVHFVDAYRSFTKIPSPQYQIIEIADLYSGVRQLVAAQAKRQGTLVKHDVDPPGLQLTADPDLVEQVLINLMLNALHALKGREDGCVALRARTGGNGLPVLQVVDNGPGISADVQERIFVPFFTTKEEGTGIGLSLSRQIMRLHGGTLSVHSRPGEQTVFTMQF